MPRISTADYDKAARLAEIAKDDLTKRLKKAIDSLGNPDLVRAGISESRIKGKQKVEGKARRKGWSAKEAVTKATDLVGIRIVCNNLQDVRRAADLIEDALEKDGISVSRQDYLINPGPGGYRAIHLDVRVPTGLYKDNLDVGCEIQIRSLLQDGWARLSRVDLYNPEYKIPDRIRSRMEKLAEELAKADAQADEIRNELARPRRGKAPKTGAKLNKSSIAFLYRRAFGSDPPRYLVDLVFDRFRNYGLRADSLDQALQDKKIHQQLVSSYQAYMPDEPFPEEVFQWVVIALAKGEKAAFGEAKNAGRRAWEEVDQVYQREMISSLPATVNELIKELENPWEEPDIEGWAAALGASGRCGICGTAIIQADTFAEAAIDHYQLSGSKADKAHERIERAIYDSGAETGGPVSSALCSYHAHQAAKDD